MSRFNFQQALHILKKDYRHLRIQILGLYFLSLVCWFSFSQGAIAREWSLTVNFGFLAGIALLIFSATRSDSVVDSSAWWATRPIDPKSLFLAKLLLWFVAIALPTSICTLALAVKFHLNASQTVLALLEMLLVTATAAGFVAAIASPAPNARSAWPVVIPITFLLFIGTLFSFQTRGYYNNTSQLPVPTLDKSLTLGLSLLAALAVGNWALKMIKRGRGGSSFLLIVGLVVFIVSSVIARQGMNPKFELSKTDKNRIQMSLLDEPEIFERAKQPTQLYSHFAYSGLHSDEFVALDWIEARFQPETGPTGRVLQFGSVPGMRAHRFDHDILSQMQAILLAHFPSTTSWSSEWNTRRSAIIPIGYPESEWTSTPQTTGLFEGTIQAQVLRLDALEIVPLKTGVYPLDSGRSLDVHAVLPQWNSIRVELALNRPRLALSKDPENNLVSPFMDEETRYVFVIYHPPSNEAYLLENKHPARRNPYRTLIPITQQPFAFNIPFSSLQSAINGLSMTDWLEDAEIRPFKINTVGTRNDSFSKQDYRPYLDNYRQTEIEPMEAAKTRLENLLLPENPSEEAVSVFIKALIDQIPDQYRHDEANLIREKLASIDPKFLPVLLRHLPDDVGLVNTYVRPAINKMIQPEHLPAFKKLWSRSDVLITEVRRQGWQDEVRETMKERIKERRAISPTVIALAAGSRDPKTYEDLRWHFTNSRWGHETMLREMERCEGLDLPPLIEQAWRRARLEINSVDSLALPAAALGLPDALRHAFFRLQKSEGDSRKAISKQLQELTSYQGPSEAFEAWLQNHLADFVFDTSERKYRLAKDSPKQ